MKTFFKKYSLQFKVLKIVFLFAWSMFKFYSFNHNDKGVDLIGGVVIFIMALISVFDFYESYKKVKAEKQTNAKFI